MNKAIEFAKFTDTSDWRYIPIQDVWFKVVSDGNGGYTSIRKTSDELYDVYLKMIEDDVLKDVE